MPERPRGMSTVTRQNVTKIHLDGFCRGTSKGGVAGHQPVSARHSGLRCYGAADTLDEIC